MELYGPDRLLQAYFLLRQQLSSCRALQVGGMPQAPSNPGTPAQLRAQLADLGWHLQDLTEQELRLLEAKLLGFGGKGSSERFLLSSADLEPDELPTGQHHPDDNRFFEVRGVQVRQPTNKALSAEFGISVREVSAAIRQGRAKVGRRMRMRKQKEPR